MARVPYCHCPIGGRHNNNRGSGGEVGRADCSVGRRAWETAVWNGDLVTVGGTGLMGGEGEGGVRWEESHRQEWAGLDWKS